MELIDKHSLVGQDGLFSKRGCYGNCQHCSLWSSEGCRVILEAPAIDAVEVTHGKWIEDGESIYCSACGFETSSLLPYVYDGEKWVPCYANKYCGNCGAKMDGGN